MGGVGFQQAFIFLFLLFAYYFHRTMLQEGNKPRQAFHLLYAIYLVLAFITVRTPMFKFDANINESVCDQSDSYHLPSLRVLPGPP